MVKLYDKGAYLVNGTKIVEEEAQAEALTGKKVCKDEARKGTIAYGIMEAHNTSGNMENLKIKSGYTRQPRNNLPKISRT